MRVGREVAEWGKEQPEAAVRLVEDILLKYSLCLSSYSLLHCLETLKAVNCYKHRAHLIRFSTLRDHYAFLAGCSVP